MLDMTKQDGIPWVASPHTPTPWSEFAESGDWWIQQCDAEGNPIGETVVSNANDMSAADMFFILQACNSFDALVAACKEELEVYDGMDVATLRDSTLARIERLRAALAKAGKV